MNNKKVAIVACNEYDYNLVQEAVTLALDTVCVSKELICGKKVLIKPNLIAKFIPSRCATTHPTVISAIAKYIINLGGIAIIGDSPGGPLGNSRIEGIYEATGMSEAAKISGASLNYNFNEVSAFDNNSIILKKMTLMEAITQADVIITAAKLKTHGMTGYTGAVKNLYGCIPGMAKIEYHYRMPDLKSFSNMLVDLCEYIRPQISVIDAIYGMEKDGPTAGDPKKLNAIIASLNPHAADVAALKLINVDPKSICTIMRAIERGLIKEDYSDIEIIGDFKNLLCMDFIINKSNEERIKILDKHLPKFLHQRTKKWMTPKPVFIRDKCRTCRECEKVCPSKAITMGEKIPQVDLDKCIRCYCCHELCPFQAVFIKRPWLTKMR